MSKIWTRGLVAAIGLLLALPAVGSARAHYTGVAPASVKASLLSTRTHSVTTVVKKKHKKHKKHKKAAKASARKAFAHAKKHRAAA